MSTQIPIYSIPNRVATALFQAVRRRMKSRVKEIHESKNAGH
ncbi:MAG: hypothetical protein ACPGYK_01770 [Flavobacteriales bacterium]